MEKNKFGEENEEFGLDILSLRCLLYTQMGSLIRQFDLGF